jgi:hypothetical protein
MEKSGMTPMKAHFTGFAVAALLVAGFTLPGYAEDAAAPTAPAAAQKEAAPASVPRPSLAPKTAEPASAPATTESDARSPRRCPSSLAQVWLLPHRLLGAVSDLLAASLPQPDPLGPDTLVQLLKRPQQLIGGLSPAQIQFWNSISRLNVAIDVPTNAAEIGSMAAKPANATTT